MHPLSRANALGESYEDGQVTQGIDYNEELYDSWNQVSSKLYDRFTTHRVHSPVQHYIIYYTKSVI